MKKSVSTVVFDFGNVLAKVERLKICAHLAHYSPYSPEEVCARIYNNDIEYDSETGKYDSREHYLRIKERIQGNHGWTYEQFYREYKDGLSLNPEGIKALEMAAAQKRVFILSNISYLHALWLFEQEILITLPELHIFSFKVGVMKPDPEIWQTMMRLGSVKPDECLYIDDVEHYCQTAERLGLNTIHYRWGHTNLSGELSRWL